MTLPRIPKILIGCTGEYFVAYRLSAMGYVVALPRAGVPSIDMMVGTADGRNALTIQVKTQNEAFKAHKRKQEYYWSWEIGEKAAELRGEMCFYAFVDLQAGLEKSSPTMPDVFIIPADDVARMLKKAIDNDKWSGDDESIWVWPGGKDKKMRFFGINADANRNARTENLKGNWDVIKCALNRSR